MAMTQQVKAELATLDVTKPELRRAEVAAVLRFANGLHVAGGRIVVEAELDTGAAARRLRTAIAELFGFTCEFVVITGAGLRRGTRYVVRLIRDGEALARQTGLIDSRGRPVQGLPVQVVSGGLDASRWPRGVAPSSPMVRSPNRAVRWP